MIIRIKAWYIKKISSDKTRYDPEPDSYRRNKVNVELDLSNYATRLDLKGVAGINKSKVAT